MEAETKMHIKTEPMPPDTASLGMILTPSDTKTSDDIIELISSYEVTSDILADAQREMCESILNTWLPVVARQAAHQRLSGIHHRLCNICKKTFKTQRNLIVHIKKVHAHEKQEFNCQICGKEYNFPYMLKRHMKKWHRPGLEKFKCHICLKKYMSNDILQRHIINQHTDKSKQCELCSKTFKTKSNKEQHVLDTHSSSEYEQCAKCQNIYKNKTCLLNHMCEVQSSICTYINNRKIPCEICNTMVPQYNMTYHIHCIHSGIDESQLEQKCPLCGKTFTLPIYLKKHMMRHELQHLRPKSNLMRIIVNNEESASMCSKVEPMASSEELEFTQSESDSD